MRTRFFCPLAPPTKVCKPRSPVLEADALRKEGFTEDEVEQIFFRNAQRFFEENL